MDTLGILMLMLSLICLGTWPAFMRLCSCKKELAEIIRQSRRHSNTFLTTPLDRHPCYVYLDYSFSYVIASSIPVIIQIAHQESNSVFAKPFLIIIAVVGGFLLSLANIAMQWSISVYNAPLTTVVALQSSLCVVLGTSINYMLQPERTTQPHLLFMGVASFLVAILTASRAQIMYQTQKDQRQQFYEIPTDGSPLQTRQHDGNKNHGSIELHNTHPNTSQEIDNSQNNDRDLRQQNNVQLGIIVAFLGGICVGFFTPAFNIAVNDPFQWYDGGLPVPYANLWFAFSFAFCSIIGNLRLMKGTAFSSLESTTWQNYSNESWHERRLACCAGMVCAMGNWLQFQGGYLAGFAAADMVQAFPLVSTLWDYFLFHEFRHISLRVAFLLVIMYVSYLFGISMLALSI